MKLLCFSLLLTLALAQNITNDDASNEVISNEHFMVNLTQTGNAVDDAPDVEEDVAIDDNDLDIQEEEPLIEEEEVEEAPVEVETVDEEPLTIDEAAIKLSNETDSLRAQWEEILPALSQADESINNLQVKYALNIYGNGWCQRQNTHTVILLGHC